MDCRSSQLAPALASVVGLACALAALCPTASAQMPDDGFVRTLVVGKNTTEMAVSTDSGLTWRDYSAPIFVQTLLRDPAQPGRVFIGSFAGQNPVEDGIHVGVSNDLGMTVDPVFVESKQLEPLPCTADSQIYEVCVELLEDNPCDTLPPGAQGHGSMPVVRAFDIDRVSPGVQTVVSTDHGLHVTVNGGSKWKWICEDIIGFDVHAFSFVGPAQADPYSRTWLAGSKGVDCVDDEFISGFYRSVDGGCNWSPVPGILEDQWVTSISVDPGSPTHVVVATSRPDTTNGLALSTDGAETFLFTWTAPPDHVMTSLFRSDVDSDVLYATTDAALLRSTDGGQSWTQHLTDLVPNPTDQLRVVGLDPLHAEVVYLYLNRLGQDFLYASYDGGGTATMLRQGQFQAFTVADWIEGEPGDVGPDEVEPVEQDVRDAGDTALDVEMDVVDVREDTIDVSLDMGPKDTSLDGPMDGTSTEPPITTMKPSQGCCSLARSGRVSLPPPLLVALVVVLASWAVVRRS